MRDLGFQEPSASWNDTVISVDGCRLGYNKESQDRQDRNEVHAFEGLVGSGESLKVFGKGLVGVTGGK